MISNSTTLRRALTLIELVVVLAVLISLAAIVLPRVSGITGQANSAATSNVISDMDKAIGTFEARYSQAPNGWDGILTDGSSGTFYPNLNPKLQTSISSSANPLLPILYPVTLTATQLQSLNNAGITYLHFNAVGSGDGRPSDSGTSYSLLAAGSTVAGLYIPLQTGTTPSWTAHGSTFPDRAFNINPFNAGATDSFVVFGIGQPCSLRGAAIQDSPIVQSANPTQYYARMLAVYHIPGPNSTTPFNAQFVGTFAPDGTCLNDNISNYDTADVPLGTN